ncbi:ATP-dependent DNA helicase Q4 [Diabrotica undecimpunctata]|uniref:ATP-dependent DNA helicase Q4 n=1 Tax=Diabrotica undecimpunctata TaxID=50387 RepID=UPI003B636271
MDLLDPELQKTYDKCKYIVKVWEHRFQKKYKRVPSKLDIKEASKEVRRAYGRYFQLKSAILEQSFKGVEGFDDVESENENIGKEPPSNSETKPTMVDEEIKEDPLSKNYTEEFVQSEEAWGVHITNKLTEEKIEEEKPKLNLSITKKLFCGSKFSKRNPRKSLSASQKVKNDKTTLSQPMPSFSSFSSEEALNILQNDNSESSFMGVNYTLGTLSQPLNAMQMFIEGSHTRSLKTVDEGWLKRAAQFTNELQEIDDFSVKDDIKVESTKLDYNSDDVIENSDEDEDSSNYIPSLHIAKKRKVLSQSLETSNKEDNINDKINTTEKEILVINQPVLEDNRGNVEITEKTEFQEPLEQIQDVSSTSSLKNHVEISSPKQVTPSKNIRKKKEKPVDNVIDTKRTLRNSSSSPRILKKSNKNTKKTPKNKSKKQMPTPPPTPQRISLRKNKLKVNLQEFSSGEEDAFLTDTDDKDPPFELEKDKKKRAPFYISTDDDNETSPKKASNTKKKEKTVLSSVTVTKRGKKKKDVNADELENDDNTPYDLEFSIKPRIVAPRYGSIKNILSQNNVRKGKKLVIQKDVDNTEDDNVKIKDKQQQAKEKLQQKISSGSLNDNFVRININKKVFVRGKSKFNFSKYKKTQWKKAKSLAGPDMYMGGCDGGMETCFTCGQVGHFAQNCKAMKGDSLLPLDANIEEECPIPTLEEASKMAQEGNLNIRKPKIALKEIQNSDSPENIQEEDSCFDDEFDSDQLLLETMKLEEHVKKLDVQMYMDNVKVVEPYYKLNEDGSVVDTPPEVFETLRRFGHSSFRPGQEEAVMRILSGKSTLVTLSTGSGKSLCYQLPAFLYSQREPCISLIISPLVSLMDDQIVGIAKFMRAACLHSNQTTVQRKKILEAISLGELSILLVSPEAVVSGEKQKGFNSFLRKLPPIAFACIDEAHCVSQWSHNFRPSYLMICRVLRESLGVKTILGLTATATKATQSSIIEHLQIPDGEDGVISDIPLPDNLHLSVSKDVNRDNALLELLLSDRFKDCKSIIVYCTRRQECERIAGFLRTCLKEEEPVHNSNAKKRKRMNLQAEPYHAGLSASRRRTIQNAFMSGQLRIVVATVAFGMGINKSDIRAVIHYNMPSSFESYVQEVGRAGRDGLKAQCHVFLDSKGGDENELRRHIHSNSIDHHVIRKLLERIFIPCSCKGTCPKHEVAFSIEAIVRSLDIPEENIATLLCYLELHKNKYIELLSPAYTNCKVISYAGPLQIRKVAKDCPPLAMALALHKNDENNRNILEFPIVDVASAMGWESGICKHKLKNLEWTTVNNQPKRSSINVEFSNLGFRLFAPGNLEGDQLDEALETLYNRVVEQERTALLQLNAIHQTLLKVAKTSFKACTSEDGDDLIKTKVREYFNSPNPLELVSEIKYPKLDEERLIQDIHCLISMYRDNSFTGRAVARIFQGIQSPNYPARMWGRCKFWRSHLDKDFHAIVKIAAKEIVKLR